jgi:tRNA1(Val) A37 N6-methylase TrmN6
LLSKFATVKQGDTVADFCSGSGIVGLHLYGLNAEKIKSVTLFEMQKSLYDLSVKSIELNNLTDKFTAVNTKLQDITSDYNEKFSLIVCNPPYMRVNGGFDADDQSKAVCRAEKTLPLSELLDAIKKHLKFGGRVAMVHRADRLVDIVSGMRERNIEPKRLQLVSGGNKPPYLVLIEGVKGGKPSLKVLNNLEN